MPERPTITQAIQLGVETTPGTGVAATVIPQSFNLSPGVSVDMQRFRPTGSKLESIIVPGKEWVEYDIDSQPTYTELHYLLGAIMAATGTNPTVDTAPAQLWSFEIKPRTPDTVKTYTWEQGDSNFAHKFSYGLVTELGMEFTRDGISASGSGIAQAIQTGATMTGALSPLVQVPILPTEVDVYWDTAFGSIGTTKLTRAFRASLSISDRFAALWALNSTVSSFAAHIETAPTLEVELLVQADGTGVSFLPTMRAGSTGYMRIRTTSLVLAATGKPYQLTWDLPLKVVDVDDFSDEDGVYAIQYTMGVVTDPNLNPKAVLRNIQTAY